MKGPGLLWMLQTAAGLSMAGPMFVMGFDLLRTGQMAGGIALFTLGAIALYLPTYLIQRIGGPRTWIRRRLGSAGRGSEDESGSDAETDLETDSASGSDSSPGRVLERLRGR